MKLELTKEDLNAIVGADVMTIDFINFRHERHCHNNRYRGNLICLF